MPHKHAITGCSHGDVNGLRTLIVTVSIINLSITRPVPVKQLQIAAHCQFDYANPVFISVTECDYECIYNYTSMIEIQTIILCVPMLHNTRSGKTLKKFFLVEMVPYANNKHFYFFYENKYRYSRMSASPSNTLYEWWRLIGHAALASITRCAEHVSTHLVLKSIWRPGPRLNTNMLSYQYKDSHVKDKTVSWPSYL